jgi:hypothetical protein
MNRYDFCLAWNWQYDLEFVNVLERACQEQGISLFQVTPTNLTQTLDLLEAGQLSFHTYFDRASDADAGFMPLSEWARQNAVIYINRLRLARHAWDKAAVHWQLVNSGLATPKTLIIPPCSQEPNPMPPDLKILGERFVIKPAHGGGGRGVITDASTWQQVLAARQEYPEDHYLLQSFISPAILDSRPAWFRLIYCAGQIIPCWWDQRTHIYTHLTDDDQLRFDLQPLSNIMIELALLSQLELFSTEIAYTPAGEFVLVDYINDPIDLRLQSKTLEGVPDQIVEVIAQNLVSYVAAGCQALPFYIRL